MTHEFPALAPRATVKLVNHGPELLTMFADRGHAYAAEGLRKDGVELLLGTGVAEIGQSIKLAPGTDPDSQMGPLISDEQFEKVLGYMDSGRAEGAEAVIGGGREGDRGYFVKPTILTNTNPDMKVVREEIFGPVVCAIPFNSPDDIVPIANDTSYGLSSGVCTNRLDYITRCINELEVGSVNVWEVPGYRIEMSPFGGIKDSGLGFKEGVWEAMKSYTNVKTYSLPWPT